MKIKYFRNGEKTFASAYSKNEFIDGVSDDIVYGLGFIDGKVFSRVSNNSKVRSCSVPFGDDSFDQNIGEEVARDKAIVKFYSRENKKIDVLIETLEELLNKLKHQKDVNEGKIERAKNICTIQF